MQAERGFRAAMLGVAAIVATYVAVAPFSCTDGSCSGWVAFDYREGANGHLQAILTAVAVGAVVALLVRAATGEQHRSVRLILTVLLIAGIVVCLLSQSVLFIVGPLVGGLVLWSMWRRAGTGT